ncbi:uncharacterized protein TRIREDRAFT_109335 [Trichoderma reesei QM6a]|jgi:hypothetical protein|uniref:Predicted protein n=2 Tax=Hypocrea jecorina TaxID=51453 RepID=G0RPE5_HYPJQ|nr:uncharacterized protein TRIREDRAFT_109335 [Trichoderma reesei QM6a]EGR47094.1 predicted protein [Trichoderma reesei QM6a]ETR99715.1 hypothetical protein M419DRAFT_85257 [Trichoderma reesei RUT C-30]
MPSLFSTLVLALGMFRAAVASEDDFASMDIMPGDFRPDLYQRAVDAGLAGLCTCPNLFICLGDKSQCTMDNKGSIICCAMGQRAFNGQCVDAAASLCADGITVCSANTQCATDNLGATICCPAGQKAVNGRCTVASTNLCADGKNMCAGATPQCTINVSVSINGTDISNTICCANGQKALDGRCYAGNAQLVPCGLNGPCNVGTGYYCAMSAGVAPQCCKQDSYLKGAACVKKP